MTMDDVAQLRRSMKEVAALLVRIIRNVLRTSFFGYSYFNNHRSMQYM